MNLPDYLGSLGACTEAREWAAGYSTLAEAWTACERADWLLWYAGKRGVDRKILVRAACACARTALPHVPPGEDRPRLAIELAEAWCNGRATIVEVRTAANAAANAAYDAYDANAAYAAAYAATAYAAAADAAANAAYAAAANAAYAAAAAADAAPYAAAADAAAYAAAYAAANAAYAAAAAAADADADADARSKAHLEMCVLVRALIPCPSEP